MERNEQTPGREPLSPSGGSRPLAHWTSETVYSSEAAGRQAQHISYICVRYTAALKDLLGISSCRSLQVSLHQLSLADFSENIRHSVREC